MVRQTVRAQIDRKERSRRVGRGVCNGDSHGVDVRMEAMASSEEDDCGEASSRSEAKDGSLIIQRDPEREDRTQKRSAGRGRSGKGGEVAVVSPGQLPEGTTGTLWEPPRGRGRESGCYRVAEPFQQSDDFPYSREDEGWDPESDSVVPEWGQLIRLLLTSLPSPSSMSRLNH